MHRALAHKEIRQDFIDKMILTEDEIKILEMLLKGYSVIKMANLMYMSDRNVGKIIRRIKDKFEDYRELETAKWNILSS